MILCSVKTWYLCYSWRSKGSMAVIEFALWWALSLRVISLSKVHRNHQKISFNLKGLMGRSGVVFQQRADEWRCDWDGISARVRMTANTLEGEDEKRERETIKVAAKAEENSYLVSGKSVTYWIQFLIFKLKKSTKLRMMILRDEQQTEEYCSHRKTFLLWGEWFKHAFPTWITCIQWSISRLVSLGVIYLQTGKTENLDTLLTETEHFKLDNQSKLVIHAVVAVVQYHKSCQCCRK